MLSLGGIPPTVGFMGKLLIFRSAVDAGLVGLAIVGVLASAAGVYYYLRVVVYMYMRPSPRAPSRWSATGARRSRSSSPPSRSCCWASSPARHRLARPGGHAVRPVARASSGKVTSARLW